MRPGVAGVLRACRATFRRVAVVSFNYGEAVSACLNRFRIRTLAGPVIGLEHIDLAALSTSTVPDHVRRAVAAAGGDEKLSTLVSANPEVLYAARNAGVHRIGLVTPHASRKYLATSGAAVVSVLSEFTAALEAVPLEL